MNFRLDKCPDDGAWRLAFGEASHMRFDQFGRMDEVYIAPLDRQFRHSAQRIVLDAAARVRLQMARGLFGGRKSALRRMFLEPVAKVANDMEAAL